ncbi:MAG TPA: DUF4823 domain-containing protein [Reyranella sp.]|jgi:hypothetical protein|nr:DUF4823 domain-containing protein [Reyranella sp.]
MKALAIRLALLATFTCTVVLGLAACTASYKQRETAGLEASSVRLDASKNVFVSVSPDGQYGSKTYPGTGRTVAQKTAAAFSRYVRRVEVGGGPASSRDELLAAARNAGAGYLVIPSITHWEQRATEWSGIPSRVSMSLTVVDTQTGAEVRSALLESRSAVMTMIRPNPDNLAQEMIDQQVSAFYGVQNLNQ